MNEKIEIERFDEIDSTNAYAKEKIAGGHERIVVAKRQTGGRGTKGRSFSSEEGGVYLSRLSFPSDLPARAAFTIMAEAAVAVCETLRRFGLRPVIKWANDIHVNGKKICGILIENVLSGKFVRSSIVGIGLNVNNALPPELADIATSIRLETGKTFSTEEVTAALIKELSKPHSMAAYRAYLGYMGERAVLLFADGAKEATLLSVDDTGGLLVRIEEEIRRVTAAEVSVRVAKEKV